jgi:hypothetical protein
MYCDINSEDRKHKTHEKHTRAHQRNTEVAAQRRVKRRHSSSVQWDRTPRKCVA